MAIALSPHHHHRFLSSASHFHTNPSSSSAPRSRCSARPKAVPESSDAKRGAAAVRSSSPPELRPAEPRAEVEKARGATPKSLNWVDRVFESSRDGFRFSEIGLEILSIALPAALALAADPITSLVDSAFVGHIGSSELAAVGVSASVFNLVSKLFNVPLLNITTSFVAEEQAVADKSSDNYHRLGDEEQQTKKILPSVSTSLALATGIGIAETIALSAGSGFWINLMGISVDSPIRIPAEQFLYLRAFGAPAIVVALAAQGAFRGFKDTKTPLYAIVAGNLLNAFLDPILIFLFDLGIGGAAVATVISEYLIALILLWKLNDEVLLISPNFDGRKIIQYLKSGGLLIGRTLAVLITMTLATSMAARRGPIPMAGYQICTQVWLTVSLLTDALAIAGQALLARGYSQGDYQQAREVIYMVLQIGVATGVALAVILFVGFGAFARLFSTDSEVLEIAWSGILFVAGSQPMNAVAFVIDGLYYGVSDFRYAAYSMVFVGIVSSAFLLATAPTFGLAGVWTGLFLFMTLRVVAGVWRLGTKGGPWERIWSEAEQGSD
ncbi:protein DETOXIFICATION 44, chloroplastic isoform X2 [Syzygium oleosum]|uniref:protein DETOXIFICATION 44, chloroplastic isoform X2 n=1 Tax=Syzygium oleosum TaxID=219896 RepID=UPI0024BBC95F|nr:protein DETOXIFICATION 44, chloroplastic isoform X2 [Syzygium oleosum]